MWFLFERSPLTSCFRSPLARAVTHTSKEKCAQRPLRVALRTSWVPSSAASPPSPSIPLFIQCFIRPLPFICNLSCLYLPPAGVCLSSVPCSSSKPQTPRTRYPSMLLLNHRSRLGVLASSFCLCSVRTCVVLTVAALRTANAQVTKHWGIARSRQATTVVEVSGRGTDFISSLKPFSGK